jgi:glycosyltransferase involved in cell wall biosynthesis
MAVHNGLPHLPDAVESILGQSFADFEFLIVDDASTDGSSEYLALQTDPRIRLITNATNQGLTRSLNHGLDEAQGEYVARMDHDDLSLPGRLAAQVSSMDAHPEIDVLGAWARTLGLDPEQTWRYPLTDADIRAELLFASVLVHSSVMLRRASFKSHNLRYDPNIARAQDYELWTRAAAQLRFANLGKVLLRYRVHPEQIGAQQNAEQQAVADEVRARQLAALGLQPSLEELAQHNAIARWDYGPSAADLDRVEAWLLHLAEANRAAGRYAPDSLARALERRWWSACRHARLLGLEAWRRYRTSPLSDGAGRGPREKSAFFADAVLREWGFRQ